MRVIAIETFVVSQDTRVSPDDAVNLLDARRSTRAVDDLLNVHQFDKHLSITIIILSIFGFKLSMKRDDKKYIHNAHFIKLVITDL